MAWRFTNDVHTYADRAWDLLAADPAEHTIALTVIEGARHGQRWSADGAMLFGWYDGDAEVRGAVSLTPPFELWLALVPDDTVAELVAALRAEGVSVPGVNGPTGTVDRFAAAWTRGTPLRSVAALELCLHRLGTLRPPAPPPPGRARPADDHDFETAVRWMRAFQAETDGHATDVEPLVRGGIDDGRLWLWEDDAVVALAGRAPAAAGVARIAPVYTPPDWRGRGYATALTAACTADAIHRGAEHVVLFTDLANPTSNAIYRRIGFRPIGGYRLVRFEE